MTASYINALVFEIFSLYHRKCWRQRTLTQKLQPLIKQTEWTVYSESLLKSMWKCFRYVLSLRWNLFNTNQNECWKLSSIKHWHRLSSQCSKPVNNLCREVFDLNQRVRFFCPVFMLYAPLAGREFLKIYFIACASFTEGSFVLTHIALMSFYLRTNARQINFRHMCLCVWVPSNLWLNSTVTRDTRSFSHLSPCLWIFIELMLLIQLSGGITLMRPEGYWKTLICILYIHWHHKLSC